MLIVILDTHFHSDRHEMQEEPKYESIIMTF